VTLSVVIPTLNAALVLPATLAALGRRCEVVAADGDSADDTAELARRHGARVVLAPRGRGSQLIAGANAATSDWLLFLHADTVPEAGWRGTVEAFMADPANRNKAAVFRFAVDDESASARRLESLVAWRVRRLGLPYGDQGLLIHRDFYRTLGGFRPLPLMEDVDLVRRIGSRRLVTLPIAARTSAERWRRDGWRRRSLRNLACLILYFLGLPPRLILKLYA
jgi:rSAM/selenodomain-associated transferase 2